MLHRLRQGVAGLRRLVGRRLLPGTVTGPYFGEAHYRRPHALTRSLLGQPTTLAYRIYVPKHSSATGPLPLLIMLHGCRQDAEQFAAGTRMNRLAEREGFFVVYPEQSARRNALRCWSWFRHHTQEGDGEATLISGLVIELCESYAIDRQRIYVAGMSAGAAMARVLSLRCSWLLAACAMHSGLMYRAANDAVGAVSVMKRGSAVSADAIASELAALPASQCAQIPTLVIQGADDETVNPVHLEQLSEQYRAIDAALLGQPSSSLVLSQSSGRRAGRLCQSSTYTRGGMVLLRTVLIEGLGHAWSGGDSTYAFNDDIGPDASGMIWDFVSRYRLGDGRVSRVIPR